MFDVPFRYGAPWDRQADATHSAVVVLSRALNDRLFGGADSVGRTLRIDTQDYRIVGSPTPGAISGFLLAQAGLTRATGESGAVTLVQRFGSALNLNIHFHMIFLDGVYLPAGHSAPVFRHVSAPTGAHSYPRSQFVDGAGLPTPRGA